MADSSGQPSGAARRRRERRLRSMLRHEQQTVRMALAAALHHSAGPKEKVEMQQNGAPRGQKTAARAREVEEQATHDGLRAQTAPPPGVRPGSLAEPGPQRSDRSLRRSSGQTPLLGVPSLADAPAEAIDGRTLRYLLKANLARKKNEEEEEEDEEEEERKYKERAAESRRRAQALLDHAASLPKRKKKKRKKKKLPRTPRPRQGRRRPCDHQRHVLAVRGASVPVHRQNGGHSCFMSMDLADPVSSGKYSRIFVFTAPVAEPTVMSFTVSWNGYSIVATATVVTSCSCGLLCCGSVCVAMSCCGGFFTPDGAYDSVWDRVKPMTGKYFFNYFQYQEFVGCVCMLNTGSAASTKFAQTTTTIPGSS